MKKVLALLLISFIILTFFAIIGVSAASQTFTASGIVLDRHGQPVKGASVTLEDGGASPIGTTTTNANGEFEFVDAVITGMDKNCRVKIAYTEGDKTYYAGDGNMRWVSSETSGGRVVFDTADTTLTDYPPPEYGYLTGTLLSDGSETSTLANGVVYAVSNDLRYYTITSNGADKGQFSMRLPDGHYEVYAQYTANGKIYQSPSKDVDITGIVSSSKEGSININMPMSVEASNPVPSVMPTKDMVNTVSGVVKYNDSTPVQGQLVELYQANDDGSNYNKVKEVKTDDGGAFQFDGVQVTGDAPDSSPVYGSKNFYVSVTYNTNGKSYVQNKSFALYNPDTLTGNDDKDQQNRNIVANITIPYSNQGWVMLRTDKDTPSGIRIYVDDTLLKDSNDNAITTLPYIAYLQPGPHTIKFTAPGYDAQKIPVNILENQQTADVVAHMGVSLVPSWVPFAAGILILLAVIVAIVVLLVKGRHMIIGPLGGITSSIKGMSSKPRASNRTNKSDHKDDNRRTTEQNVGQLPRGAPRPRDPPAAIPPVPYQKSRSKKSDHDPAIATGSGQPGLPEYRGDDYEYDDELSSRVSSRKAYRIQDSPATKRVPPPRTALNRSNYDNSPIEYDNSPIEYDNSPGGYDIKPLSPAVGHQDPEDGRIRIPRSLPVARDQLPVTSVKDKERVVRYIRDHEEGVSFIQMSTDLEIDTTTLNIITRELVINDDIEKIRGLYYNKSRDASGKIHESSVVVWRLDGDE